MVVVLLASSLITLKGLDLFLKVRGLDGLINNFFRHESEILGTVFSTGDCQFDLQIHVQLPVNGILKQ